MFYYFLLKFHTACVRMPSRLLAVIYFGRGNREKIDRKAQPAAGTNALSFETEFPQSFWKQYLIIMKKNSISYNRNPQYTAVRFSCCTPKTYESLS